MNQPIKFRRIGAGFCDSVWAAPEDTSALKREDGGPGISLTNDFEMHKQVLKSLDQQLGRTGRTIASIPIQIPRCHQLIEAEDEKW